MGNSNKKKSEQLGMAHGTAANRLRKMVMFYLLVQGELNKCHQCGEWIRTAEELSIEHKIPWLDSEDPIGLYFDINNIAFSHLSCNIGAARRLQPWSKHGTQSRYTRQACRCEKCTAAHAKAAREYRGHAGQE